MNVHGLDADEDPVSSAQDLARLSRELIEYPRILEWSSRSKDSFRDGRFILRNRNQLVGVYPGLDGLKTGYTRRAGYCLVAMAVRDDLRLISVVMGAPTEKMRFSETVRLLNRVFDRYRKVPIVRKGERVGEIKVVRGRSELVVSFRGKPCSGNRGLLLLRFLSDRALGLLNLLGLAFEMGDQAVQGIVDLFEIRILFKRSNHEPAVKTEIVHRIFGGIVHVTDTEGQHPSFAVFLITLYLDADDLADDLEFQREVGFVALRIPVESELGVEGDQKARVFQNLLLLLKGAVFVFVSEDIRLKFLVMLKTEPLQAEVEQLDREVHLLNRFFFGAGP